MKKLLLSIAVLSVCLPTVHAQTGSSNLGQVLSEIERNNLRLQAMRLDNKAESHNIDAENRPEATSVEYSPFFRREVSGIASSELVVSQEFDFPTIYGARSKSGQLRKENLNIRYMALRRELLLDAKQKYLDLILLSQNGKILAERMANSDELLALYDKKFRQGDATVIEINKIKMERMNLQTELLQNESDIRNLKSSLSALNADRPLPLDSVDYPDMPPLASYDSFRESVLANDITIKTSQSDVKVAEQELRVTKQGWLPKLSIGYRRNTEIDEASNGFLVGASFNLFSNGSRVKSSRIKKEAAELALDNARIEAEAELRELYDELAKISEMLKIYDIGLMNESLRLLRKSVEYGNTPLLDYYTEADQIYLQIETYLSLNNRYHKLMAEIDKNSL